MFFSLCFLFFLLLVCTSHGLATIRVTTVKTTADILALADIRYNEWIATGEDGPSQRAFRMATIEIFQERAEAGAVTFLAWADDGTAAGAAELSPIELQGATTENMLYVTDVVTVYSHRRKGCAASLMDAMETEATTKGASYLLLHVKEDNIEALAFYRNPRVGYQERLLESSSLDTIKLAKNANTEGQILLMKMLAKKLPAVRGGGRGFKI
jgi:ribosomal protein S18 acetylase RimI-like enzyme